jgi:hypothetical protein
VDRHAAHGARLLISIVTTWNDKGATAGLAAAAPKSCAENPRDHARRRTEAGNDERHKAALYERDTTTNSGAN